MDFVCLLKNNTIKTFPGQPPTGSWNCPVLSCLI